MSSQHKKVGLAALTLIGVTAVILSFMGQPFFCRCGTPTLWTSEAWSFHTSQHLLDPYSFTHFSHGLLFFWFLYLLRDKLAVASRFFIAVTLECCWELFENSPWVIDHYRQNTASLEYYGDSVVNSIGDLLCCSLGFLTAASTPWWASAAIFSLFELGLLFTVRDNLTLNILNLTGDHPRIVEWQAKAASTK